MRVSEARAGLEPDVKEASGTIDGLLTSKLKLNLDKGASKAEATAKETIARWGDKPNKGCPESGGLHPS